MVAVGVDLGASSGRVVAGRLEDQRLHVCEVHRFPNNPVRVGERLHWDILRLLHDVKQGILAAKHAGLGDVETVGIDTWGLDFGLIGAHGELLGNPFHYRDEQTRSVLKEIDGLISREELFARTGIQVMPVNTLFQLWALKRNGSTLLDQAAALLMIPDLLRFFLSGEQSTEATIASTTQFLGLESGDWDQELVAHLRLPTDVLTPVIPPCGVAGILSRRVAAELELGLVQMTVVAEHDTASAVAAIPASGEFAYLSCGTWSLLGSEVTRPIVDARARSWNFTNERGMSGRYLLQSNITGLWLVEECRRIWARESQVTSYEQMAQMIEETPAFGSFIDPNDPRFLCPTHMPHAIQAACRATGQHVPDSPAAILRCIHESLALTYCLALKRTEALTGRNFPSLHVVGGGTRNRSLLQFTANAIGRPVCAGPTEATVTGNVLAQLLATGALSHLQDGREMVSRSFPATYFEPRDEDAWSEAFERYCEVAFSTDRSAGGSGVPEALAIEGACR